MCRGQPKARAPQKSKEARARVRVRPGAIINTKGPREGGANQQGKYYVVATVPRRLCTLYLSVQNWTTSEETSSRN